METRKSRAALPTAVPREDAVFNMQRVLWLIAAFAGDRPEELGGTFQDRLHQPYRKKFMPFLDAVIDAAVSTGAYGAFLSGSGSVVLAVCEDQTATAVAMAMAGALSQTGYKGFTRVLRADNEGLRVCPA
jgi:homoserine kinase